MSAGKRTPVSHDRGSAKDSNGSKAKSTSATVDSRVSGDSDVNTCFACRKRLGPHSYRGAVITALGIAEFRLCVFCREDVSEQMLARIMREGEQRLALTGPVGGHA